MTSIKRNQVEFLKAFDVFPSIHAHSPKRKNLFTENLWNNFSYSSDEIRLMKEVKGILNNNTFEIVKHKLHSRNTLKHKDFKQGIQSINNMKYKTSSPDQNFAMILPKKPEYLMEKMERKEKHKDSSSSASSASPNSTPSGTTIIVPKMDMKKIRPNGTEQDVTDESGELFTHSSLGSFRYQLSSSNSSKTRQRSKLQFKIRSKNFTARKFFRHKVRIVIALLRLVDCAFDKFKKNFMRIQQNQKMDNITELVQDTFSAPTDSDKVIFNKDYYKAKKETDLSRDIQYALTIPPESRTPEQIKLARIGLLRMESFAEYPVNMQEKICKCAFYQKIPSKRVVIRQGQVADSFYFIISGQAMVTVLDEDKKTGDVKNRILAVLRDGTCFGELAFLYNTTRTATVTSLTTMELISIGRDDFYDIFMSNRGQEPEHIQFLRKCEFTKDWPIQILLQNPTSCVFHYYKRNQVIVPDSAKNEYIFVVKSGTCQVMKKLENVKPRKLLQGRALSKENFLTDTYKPKVDTRLRRESIESNERHIPWSVTHLNEPSNKERQEPVFLQIQTLKAGDTFGLNILKFDETDVNVPNPNLSLISNGSEVLMLKKDFFLRHSNDKVKENIRQMFQPYTSTKEMQKKLQTAADWKYFKAKHMQELYANLKKSRPMSTKLKV